MNRSSPFPWRFFIRIVFVQTAVILGVLVITGLLGRHWIKEQFFGQVEKQVETSLSILSRDLPAMPPPDWCAKHAGGLIYRLMLIREDGAVFCDSHQDSKTMENHGDRLEVKEALRLGFGKDSRMNSNLNERLIYGAYHQAQHHWIIRGSVQVTELLRTLHKIDLALILFLVSISATLVAFSVLTGRRLATPIGRLLEKARGVAPLEVGVAETEAELYGELSDLESSLDRIRKDLDSKAESLSREREEQATLMSAISDAIIAIDLDGAPLFFNSKFAVSFGGREGLRAGKVRIWELFREPEVLDTFRSVLKEAKHQSVSALPFADGSGRGFFSLAVSPLRRSSDGAVYGAVGVFHDVTELKKAEQIRIDFVANVSHELRTPLTAIKGFTDTLRQDLVEGRTIAIEFVDIIRRNTERLMSLIQDLLDLSSLESNADELHKDVIPTGEFSSRVIGQMERLFAAKNQKVTVDVQAATVSADTRKVEQVLVNLLDNASKYTPVGGVIRVSWSHEPQADSIILRVKDEGPGIPLEHQGRLFERFYRVDKARSRELGGTGLGLAIVKHIMQRHGGTIEVESVSGQGSVFSCKFPQS